MSESPGSEPPGRRPAPVGNSGRKLPVLRQSSHRRLPSPGQSAIPVGGQGGQETVTNGFHHQEIDERSGDGDDSGMSVMVDEDEIIPTRDITQTPQSSGKASVAYISETLIRRFGKKENIAEITVLNLTLARDHMNKKIKYIENLEKLKKLQVLSLSNNIIEKIERLDKLTQLRELNLSKNYITRIEGLDTLTRLQVLNLSRNEIEHLPAGLFKRLRELRVIGLSHNRLETLVEMTRLRPLPDLSQLSVEGNPLADLAHGRQFIIFQLRSLEFIDGKKVTEDERGAADNRFGQDEVRRLEAELDKQERKYQEVKEEKDKSVLEVQRLTKLHSEQKTKDGRQTEKIKELKRELESNADLLKRKNAELSKACEKQFKLEQELAFYKLDAKFEHLGKMPFPEGAELLENGDGDESPYIGKAGFKPNTFAWDKFIQSPEQRARMSPSGIRLSHHYDGKNRRSGQELEEALVAELQSKELAIQNAEERLAALRQELLRREQQLGDAADKLGRIQQAIQDQSHLLGDQEKKLLNAIDDKKKYIRELQKLAADLENRMKQVGDDIRQREDELEKLQQDLESTPPDDKAYNNMLERLAAKDRQLKDAMDEFDSLKNEHGKVADTLRQEMAEVKKLQDELAALQNKGNLDQSKLKEDLKDLVEELSGQLDKMKQRAAQQQQRIVQLQQEKDMLGGKVKELQQQMGPASQMKEHIAKLQQQLKGAQEALDQERNNAKALHRQQEELRQRLAQAGGTDAALIEARERLAAVESEADKLRRALDKLKKQQQADRQAADERIRKEQDKVERALQAARGAGDKERQTKELGLQVDTLKATNASLADRLREAQDELQKQLDNSLDKGEVLQRLGDLKDGIDRGEVRVRSPRDEHDDLGRALASLQKRYNDLVGALQKERRGSEKEQKAVDAEIQALDDRLGEAESALQRARDGANQLSRENEAKDAQLKTMADELRRLKDKLARQESLEDELEKERSAHEMEMKNLEAEMDELKDQLRRAREGVGEEIAIARAPLLAKIRNLEDALRPLQQKLAKAMREADRLKEERAAAESGRGELEDQIADLLKALREAKARAEDAEARRAREKRDLEEKIGDLEDELEQAREQLRNLKEKADKQLQRQRATSDAGIRDMENELAEMKEKMRNLQENAAREAARNQQEEARKARLLEDELAGLMNDLQKSVDELGRAQEEAALLKDSLNDKEAQLKAAARRERQQQARLHAFQDQMNELHRMQEDVGSQTLQDKLEKELETLKAAQRRSVAEAAASRELARAQEQIAALQKLLNDKDRQLQDAMQRGSNNLPQLAAQRHELGNLAAALRAQSAEIDRLKEMFGQRFPPRVATPAQLHGHGASLTALANEVDALRSALRDREHQVEDLMQSGFQWPLGTVFPGNVQRTGPDYIPAAGGLAVPQNTSGVQFVPNGNVTTPGSRSVPPSATSGLVTTANEIHHHHHLSKKSPQNRSPKKSLKLRDQDIVLSPVHLAASTVTSANPDQVHHHHYGAVLDGKGKRRTRKEEEDLFCNVPDHENLEDEVEELEHMLETTSAANPQRAKNQRDRESLRMELRDLEGEVEDALKRRSSIKKGQHQSLDATLAKFQDHLLTIMDHKARLSTSY